MQRFYFLKIYIFYYDPDFYFFVAYLTYFIIFVSFFFVFQILKQVKSCDAEATELRVVVKVVLTFVCSL